MLLILLYFMLTASLFLINNIYYQIFTAAGVFLLLLLLPFEKVKGGLIPILLFLVFTFAGNLFFHTGRIIYGSGFWSITDDGLHAAVVRTLRIFSMICSAKALTAALPADKMVRAINRMLSPLERFGLPVKDFCSVMNLTVSALPLLTQHIAKTYAEELKNNNIRGFRSRARHLALFIMPVFIDSIRSPESFFISGDNETGS